MSAHAKVRFMGRHDDDTSTVVTVNLDENIPRSKSGKPLSEKKLAQLSAARETAFKKRRIALKSRLEAKVSELRQILGPDMRNDTVEPEHVGTAMMKLEERLRASQSSLTQQLNDVLQGMRDEIRTLRKMHAGQSHTARIDPKPATSKLMTSRAPSEISAVSSRALKLHNAHR